MKLASPLNRQPPKLKPVTATRYLRAGYRLVGKHSGIQICRWTRAALGGRRLCYKRWYGVQSHRCLQLTPLQFCNMRCIFCWRFHTSDRFKAENDWDAPHVILDEAIIAQQKLLSGFKANPRVTREKYEESMKPVHAAISLDGEPTLYPMIADLIRETRRRGMTSFLVTNGTIPERLEEILDRRTEPTNLYLSLYGPDKQTYKNVARPSVPNAWERVVNSLRLMPRFKHARTIARLTLVRGQNMHRPEQYSKVLMEGSPSIIELKGYSWLGESKQRLPISAMPYHSEIRQFAEEMAKSTGYELIAEDTTSRVVVLTKEGSTTGLSLDAR